MKKKHPEVDLENFALIPATPDDRSLPAPLGGPAPKFNPKWEEEAKYDRTMDFGGLVPERSPILDSLVSRRGPFTHEPDDDHTKWFK